MRRGGLDKRFKARALEAKRTEAPPWAELAVIEKTLKTLAAKEKNLEAQAKDLIQQTNDLEQTRFNTRAEAAALEDDRRAL